MMHGHSYADLCRDYLDIHISGKKTLRESDWGLPVESRNLNNEWWLEKLKYAANDVAYLFPLHDLLNKTLTAPLPRSVLNPQGASLNEAGLDSAEVLSVEFQTIPVIADMEYTGMPVSKTFLVKFQESLDRKLLEVGVFLCQELDLETQAVGFWDSQIIPSPKSHKILRSATGLLSLVQKALKLEKLDNTQALTLTRAIDIIDAIYKLEENKGQEEPTQLFIDEDEEELFSSLLQLERSELIAISPIARGILDYKKLSKQLSMPLDNFINPFTGRIHASFDQLGTATGRFSCNSPNLQQVSSRTNAIVNLA
jgi:hypothetical protein